MPAKEQLQCHCPSETFCSEGTRRRAAARRTYHVIPGEQLLQELGFFMHHRLDNELIVAGDVEQGAAGPGIGELDERLIT